MSLNEEVPAAEAGNITGFADLGIDQVADVEIPLRLGFGHTVLPLDYRSQAKLDADQAENEAAA